MDASGRVIDYKTHILIGQRADGVMSTRQVVRVHDPILIDSGDRTKRMVRECGKLYTRCAAFSRRGLSLAGALIGGVEDVKDGEVCIICNYPNAHQ